MVEQRPPTELEQIRISPEVLARTNRALQMLSACSDVVIRAREEGQLLTGACRSIVEIGGYPLAWIGEAADDADKSLRPVAVAGDDPNYVEGLRIGWGEDERGRGPAGAAIRSGQVVITRDTMSDPDFAPWRQRATARGYLSMAAVPLQGAGRFTGALTVYARRRDAFDEEEIALLSRLGGNLAHGIAALRAEAAAQQYLDIAASLITVLDVDGKVRLLNRRACEVLGVAPEAAIGRSWYEMFVPPELKSAEWAEFVAFIEGRRISAEYIETHVLTRCGEVRRIAWRDSLLRSKDGRPLGVISSGEDITERHSTERKRDEFKALLEATAEASPDGILVTDLAGRYLFWNRRYAAIWQLDEDYLRLRAGLDGGVTPALIARFVAQSADPEAYAAAVGRAFRGEQSPSGEEILFKDGRTVVRHVAHVRFGVRFGEAADTAIAWVYRDITEVKQREAELVQSQRLNAVGQLAGGVAHDFNNLLTVIGGNLELLKDRLGDDPRAAGFAQVALGATETAAGLTQRLLAFSRRQPLTPQPVEINRLIDEVLRLLPPLLGAEVEVSFAPAPGIWRIAVDPGQLQNAVVNLAINARDAMPKGGRVTIAVENKVLGPAVGAAEDSDLRPGDYVLITVGDEGVGMAPAVAKRAFEPFFTTKPEGHGTGLGLSTVFGFVKQSGGHIALDSAEGCGTTVKVYLPRAGA